MTALVMRVAANEAILPQPDRMVYKRVADRELAVYVFQPAEAPVNAGEAGRAAIVFLHGGGWSTGSPEDFFAACRRYAAMGLVTLSVEYRLSDNRSGKLAHPTNTPIECIRDARSAVRWVRAHAADLRIDPHRIAVGGHSVGGQLTLMTAMGDDFDEPGEATTVSARPDAMLIYSGTVNTVEAWCDMLLADRRSLLWAISPAHSVRGGLPPAVDFHGKADPTVPFWTVARFRTAMIEAGNRFELHPMEDRGHYLAEGDPTYARILDQGILETTDAFLRDLGWF